ncbi:MAG: fumarylacetoacetate hydrolase family protein [Actinomycetota bacterium]|nr:fumarylacetoacetate hydrolase family protein [Actinomycetota bacterium]
MRWVTYRTGGGERTGLVVGDAVHALDDDISLIDLLGDDGERMTAAAARAMNAPTEIVALDGADLAPPLRPPSIRDFLCFLEHMRTIARGVGMEMNPLWEKIPGFYFSSVSSVVGPHDPVRISPGCEQFDYELEVAAVIGRGGSDLAPEDAASHIVGFMLFCDWSARDLQLAEMGLNLGPAKGKDGANTLGPALVTVDELAPHRSGGSYALGMRGYVNDELVSEGSMDQMDWHWGDIVAYASRGCELVPGDVICSGTVPTGCLMEHFASDGPDKFRGWLQPGDVVRLEVEGLGSIRQEVKPAVPVRPIRTLS